MDVKDSKRRRVDDWTSVDGAPVEIVQDGQLMARGIIDGVTDDGTVVWVLDDTGRRKLYERCEHFQLWVPREDLGLNYKVSKGSSLCAPTRMV